MIPFEINKKIANLKGLAFEASARSNHVLIKREPQDAGYWKNWSENISNAFELFEEMASAPENSPRLEYCDGKWLCWSCLIDAYNFGTTAQEAICKAWIQWKECE